MPKAPYRTTVKAAVIWQLSRQMPNGTITHGQYSTCTKGQQEAERIIKKACGLKPQAQLHLTWLDQHGVSTLNYGRDQHDFRFAVEPFPLDGET